MHIIMEDMVQGLRIGQFDGSHVNSNIGKASRQFSRSVVRLASGKNGYESDSPFTISIAERLRSAIAESSIAMRAIKDRIGMIELTESKELLKADVASRIKELAIQYRNGTLSDSEKSDIQAQVDELSKLLDRGSESLNSIMSGGYQSNIKISTSKNNDLSAINILSTQTVDKIEFIIYKDAPESDVAFDVEAMMSDNDVFLNKFAQADSAESGYVYQSPVIGSLSFDTMTTQDATATQSEGSMFDLSAEGVLGEIDNVFNDYVSNAASCAASAKTLEYRIDSILNNQAIMIERLDRMTATDIAEETVNMIKSKLLMGVGAEVLKAQNRIEKNMVLSLISSM